MLQITARLFKDGQLVGYRLTDGRQTQDLTKIQAWMYAKNKQIINVTATGTQDDPQLSGTNGFKLKELPEIKFGQPESTNKTNMQLNENSTFSGNDIEVVARLVAKNADLFSPEVEGYALRNIGNTPIPIERRTHRGKDKIGTVTINPGEIICLNKVETILLVSTKEACGKFSNGKLAMGSKINSLKDCYIRPCDNKFTDVNTDDAVKNAEDLALYFGYRVNSLDAAVKLADIRRNNNNNRNSLDSDTAKEERPVRKEEVQSGMTGLFGSMMNRFKR